MQKNWYRLDTAALIFPATIRRDWCNVFRLSAGLTEPVDPAILQQATDDLRKRFPSYFVTLRRGMFWYYLEESSSPVLVREDYAYPLTFMSGAELKRNCLRVLYYRNRIAVEFFHSLTDGRGGSVFLANLVARYLELKHGIVIPRTELIRDPAEPPRAEELEDSFLKNAAEVQADRTEEVSYRLHGTPEKKGFRTLTTGIVETEALLAAAHRYHVSVTAFLAAVMAESIISIQNEECPRRRQRPVKITIPVDLRRLYGSKTLRNFSLVLNIGVDPRFGDYSLEELSGTIYHQLRALRDAAAHGRNDRRQCPAPAADRASPGAGAAEEHRDERGLPAHRRELRLPEYLEHHERGSPRRDAPLYRTHGVHHRTAAQLPEQLFGAQLRRQNVHQHDPQHPRVGAGTPVLLQTGGAGDRGGDRKQQEIKKCTVSNAE